MFAKRFRHDRTIAERNPKPFARLLRCGECGSSITAEKQKGHTYYRCTKKRRDYRCRQRYIREEALDREITDILSPYALPNGWGDDLLALFENERTSAASAAATLTTEWRNEIARLTTRLKCLKEAYLDQDITADEFRADKASMMSKLRTKEEQIDALTKGDYAWLEPLRDWISEATKLAEIVEHGSPQAKRALAAKVFGSNLVLKGRKARGRAVNPWSAVPENVRGYTTAHLFYAARTHFQNAGRLVRTSGVRPRGLEPGVSRACIENRNSRGHGETRTTSCTDEDSNQAPHEWQCGGGEIPTVDQSGVEPSLLRDSDLNPCP